MDLDEAPDQEKRWMSGDSFMNEEDIKLFRELCVQGSPRNQQVTRTKPQTSKSDTNNITALKHTNKSITFITRVDELEDKSYASKHTFGDDYVSKNRHPYHHGTHKHFSSSDYLMQHFSKSMSTGKKFAPLLPRAILYSSKALPSLYTPPMECNDQCSFIRFGDDCSNEYGDSFYDEHNENLVARIKERRSIRPQFVESQFNRRLPREPGITTWISHVHMPIENILSFMPLSIHSE